MGSLDQAILIKDLMTLQILCFSPSASLPSKKVYCGGIFRARLLVTELSHLWHLDSQSCGVAYDTSAGRIEVKHEYDYIVVSVYMFFNASRSTVIAPVPYYQPEQTASLAITTC